MPKATAPGGSQHPDQVPHAGPDHRDIGRQAMGIDHRGNGVGGIVKAVHELETKGEAERQNQKDDVQRVE